MDQVSKQLAHTISTPAYKMIIAITVIATVSNAIRELPLSILSVMSIPIVQVAIYFAGAYAYTSDLIGSAFIAFVTGFVFYLLSNYFEGFEGFNIIEPQSNVLPGCKNAELKDLLELFNGDMNALKKACYTAHVPLNIPFNDENAPKIATYLVNMGKQISETCRAPL